MLDELVRSFPTFERWFDSAAVRQQVALLASAEIIEARDMPAPNPAKPLQQGTISLHGLHLRVEFPYDPALVQQVKRLRQHHGGPGFQHDASGKYWLLTQATTEALHATFPHFAWTEGSTVCASAQQAATAGISAALTAHLLRQQSLMRLFYHLSSYTIFSPF